MKKRRSRQIVKSPPDLKDGLVGYYGHLFDKHGHVRIEFNIVKLVADGAGYLAVQRAVSDQRWSDDALLLSFDTLANREKCLLYFDAGAWHKALERDRRAVMGYLAKENG